MNELYYKYEKFDPTVTFVTQGGRGLAENPKKALLLRLEHSNQTCLKKNVCFAGLQIVFVW